MDSPTSQRPPQGKPKSEKSARNQTDKQTNTVGRCFKGSEIFHRMNFLAQVQQLVSADSPEASHLHSFYGYTLQLLSRRTQSKMHQSLKQRLCKKCSTPVLPGKNGVRVRTRGKGKAKRIVATCRICGTMKRFPTVEKSVEKKMKKKNIGNKNHPNQETTQS